MDYHDFREFSSASIEFIINYLQTIRDRDVISSAKPHDIVAALPKEIPQKPDHWKDILKDLDEIILPGLTHWQSPHFHAFYPSASSFGSIVGELLISGLGVLGFNWICSPACTELEVVVMDWLAKFLRLPEQFLHSSKGPGGGIIQGSASESVLVAVIAAREQAVRRTQAAHPEMSESDIRGKLVAYSSDQSNSCIEKAGVLGALPIRLLATEDDGLVLKGDTLRKAVEEDVAKGLIPVICIATLGTTGTCAYDDVESLGEVCQQHDIWLHVDAAYAGAAFALEEHEHLRAGLERVDSLNFNLHKFLMVNFDCGAMWLRDANKVVDSFNVDRIYLKHNYEGQSQIPDFRHWQIPLGRRFRALKVWITCRTIGAEGFRAYIRNHMALAERFEQHVLKDDRFEIVTKRTLGLVCFRAKGDNSRNTGLLERLTARKKIYMVQAVQKGQHFLRFVVCGMEPKEEDIDFAWNEIQTQMDELLADEAKDAKSSDAVDEKLTGSLTNGGKHLGSSYEQSAKSDANLLAQNLSSSLHLTADNSKNI